ncbi:MAG: ABC transporter ATP-binding protein [Oscillospiraceae bacterium]|nr:ABC transporter ATP-binding protein [Oscillospiraceae bacterium]
MIVLSDLTLGYGEETVIQGLSMGIPEGGHLALMGPSGCGKTTLLRCLAGLLAPRGGTVTGRPEKVAFAFQEPRLLPWRTAAENVNLVLGDKRATLPRAEEWLERVGLGDASDKYPAALSGGMCQRVNIARALAAEGELLLLDEPFHGLDRERAEDIAALLCRHARGRTLVLSTHRREEAQALGCEIWQNGDKIFRRE